MTTSRTSVLVTWADPDAQNMGLRVLACGSAQLARSVWGDATEVVMHSHNTDRTMLDRSHVLRDVGRRSGALTARIREFEAVIDTCGGDSFTDIYGLRRLVLLAYVHRAARKAAVPVFLSPQTIGPFRSAIGRTLARYVLHGATYVAARDPASARCAASLGREVDCEATDLAFALPVPENGPMPHGIVVNVSGLLWNPNPHVDHAVYRRETHRLVEALMIRGHRVELLAHVIDSGFTDDDVPAVDELATAFGSRVTTHAPQSLDDVRQILAGATVLVGARLHACLNALSVGTPVIPWAYSRKFEPLMSALNYPHCIDLRFTQSAAHETLALLDEVCTPQFQFVVDATAARARRQLDDLVAGMRSAAAALPNPHRIAS